MVAFQSLFLLLKWQVPLNPSGTAYLCSQLRCPELTTVRHISGKSSPFLQVVSYRCLSAEFHAGIFQDINFSEHYA